VQQFLVNCRAKEWNNLVLFDDLIHGVADVANFAFDETDGEVFGPLPGAEDPQDAHDDHQVVILLDHLLPRVVRGLGRLVRRLPRCKLNRGDKSIDD